MNSNIKCLTPQEEEKFLDILKNRKDAERAYMLYHLMLITGLRLSEALSLNVEHAGRSKLEVKVKGWTKKGEKKDRYKAVYFPKVLQSHLKDYLRVKAKKGENLSPEAPFFFFIRYVISFTFPTTSLPLPLNLPETHQHNISASLLHPNGLNISEPI